MELPFLHHLPAVKPVVVDSPLEPDVGLSWPQRQLGYQAWPNLPPHVWEYPCEVLRVIDGDTVVLRVDMGMRHYLDVSARLLGIDAREVRGVSKTQGRADTAGLKEILGELGSTLKCRTHKGDAFGRWLVDLVGVQMDGQLLNVSLEMLARGYAEERAR